MVIRNISVLVNLYTVEELLKKSLVDIAQEQLDRHLTEDEHKVVNDFVASLNLHLSFQGAERKLDFGASNA